MNSNAFLRETLRRWYEQAYDDGGLRTSIRGWRLGIDGLVVDLEAEDDEDPPSTAKWTVQCRGVVAGVCRNLHSYEVELLDQHSLLVPHSSPHASLSFIGGIAAPDLVLARLYRLTKDLSEGWLSVEQFLRVDMLDQPHGILASGPELYMRAFESVLRDLDVDVLCSRPIDLQPKPVSLLLLGRSYVIAEEFVLDQVLGE
jgi:hypothetical protein